MATLQQQVQQYLQNTGISLRELSRRSGVSHTTIGKILRGGTYKSDTAHALYTLISITPISEYVTLHDKVEAIAADRVDCDIQTRDDAMECGKQRRIEALEAEVGVWRKKADDFKWQVGFAHQTLGEREQHLKSCENALIEAHTERDNLRNELADTQDKIEYMKRLAGEDGQKIRERDSTILDLDARMDSAKAEIKRLTALSETHGQSWKAACVQVEQLQTQLDHGQTAYNKIYAQYSQQVDDEREMLAQIDTLFAERDNTATKHDQQVMRLRVYVWILLAALVFVVASGLAVWGGV